MSLGKSFQNAVDGFSVTGPTRFGKVRFDLFFDRQKVMSRLDRKERRVLAGTGAFGRGVIRRSFRSGGKKGRQSRPGEPPRYHSRGFGSLKDGIFFTADLDQGKVVIGANRLKTNVLPIGKASSAQLLEEGGRGEIISYRHNTRTQSGTRKRRRGHWKKRPYLEPAIKPTAGRMRELMKKVNL